MSDENNELMMAECGSCRAIVPIDSDACPECGISFSGVSDEALGECAACKALVPLDSTKCPDCGVVFVADDVIDILRTWMANNKMDVKSLFGRFDTNNDNMIDSSELKEGLLSLNLADLPPSQVERLVEAIDEDGDSLIDLQELQSIIGGEDLDDDTEPSAKEESKEESSLDYNENVLSKVMESSGINASDKDAFLVFAQDYNADGNAYLKKEELQSAADAWVAQNKSDEAVDDSSDEEMEEVESEEEEPVVEESEESEEELEESEEIPEESQEEPEESEEEPEESEESEEELEESEEESDDIEEDTEPEEPTPEELFLTLAEAIAEKGLTIREVFESMDTNLDGQISGPELQSGIESILGDLLLPTKVFAILGVLDEDEDGNIDPMELIHSIEKLDLGIESDRPVSTKESSSEKGRTSSEIIEQLLDFIDSEDLSLASAFGDLDDDGNRMVSRDELISKLDSMLTEGLNEREADELMSSIDADGDGNIDMVEFVTAIENHENEIATIEDEEAETVKSFPTKWQSRFMSKKWHDTIWPLIHASFAFLIIGLLVNAIFPIVDGTGGTIELEIRESSDLTEWQMDDGRIVAEGQAYPCDPEIQQGDCKNSLTPLAGKASSMPGGFYWDAIVLMVLAGAGLVWSLYTHLIRAPGWRAKVKAMKDVDDERAEIKEQIDNIKEDVVGDDPIEPEEEESEEDVEEDSQEDTHEEEEAEEEELDIGSFVGLDIDGEEYYGTIIEFDDEEETVTIEEEETGDEIVGYQDEMFIPED